MAHTLHPSILRAYDIRGIVGETFFEEDAYHIGRAFATMLGKLRKKINPVVCVGFDGRLTSPAIKEKLIEGLTTSGAHVYEVGCGPTPMSYIGVKALKADAGMMVTGSHNPPSHNGIKMMLSERPFYGEDIQALGKLCQEGQYQKVTGSHQKKDIKAVYLKQLLKGWKNPGQGLKIAWDAGNGATGEILEMLIGNLPGDHVLINEKIDGNFPNHHPDPSVPENMQQLIRAMHRYHCEIGIAFDGDGDRVGVIDHQGRILEGDQLVAILAQDVLYEHPNAKIILDIKSSQHMIDFINQKGGRAMLWKSGHSLIKAKMIEEKAAMAGEVSGHIFFADHFNFDDGIYAAIRLLNLLVRSKKSLSDWLDQLPKTYSTPEIRIDVSDEKKFQIIASIRQRLAQEQADFADIDGVRVNTDKGWWLLRASNTQAALVMRCEATSQDALEELTAICKSYICQ